MSDPGGHGSPRIPLYFKDMSGKSLTLTLPIALAKEFETLHQDLLVELLQRGLQEVSRSIGRSTCTSMAAFPLEPPERAGVSQSELSRRALCPGHGAGLLRLAPPPPEHHTKQGHRPPPFLSIWCLVGDRK